MFNFKIAYSILELELFNFKIKCSILKFYFWFQNWMFNFNIKC